MGTCQIWDEIRSWNPARFAALLDMKWYRRREATDEQWKGSVGHSELHKSTEQASLEQEVEISLLIVLCFIAY